MKIVVVEDDPHHAVQIEQWLTEALEHASVNIVRTEHEFRANLDALVRERPDLFIIDVMLRWTHPAPDMPPRPPEVASEGFYKAGFRCAELLTARSPAVPIIIYTVLDEADIALWIKRLPPTATYVRKELTAELLLERVRQVTSGK